MDDIGDGHESDGIRAAAVFVLGQEGWRERTRARHVPDHFGGCAGCSSHRSVRWPCAQIAIADHADELARQVGPAPSAGEWNRPRSGASAGGDRWPGG